MALEAILVFAQLVILYLWVYNVTLVTRIDSILQVFALLLVIRVINREEDSAFKIGWCVLILALPLLGCMLYLMCAGRKMPKKLTMGTTQANEKLASLLEQDPNALLKLDQKPEGIRKLFYNSLSTSRLPVYDGTRATYYKSGEDFFPDFLAELKKAKHFIFMEYFIIDLGSCWDEILAILKQKVEEGLEVKLVYDDFGCMGKLPWRYERKLNEMGIETYRFNPVRPALMIQMNNRDHRKICVIDNQVGFTGGINLADEYMNRVERFGYWKDSAVRIEGKAVWSLTDMFLGMYSYLKQDTEAVDYDRYHLACESIETTNLFQPFSDTPTDNQDITLSLHLNLVNQASEYIYIDTPYLILNSDMTTALKLAAHNGVDVRILVPHIPDKKAVFMITQSNYESLIQAGIRIFEFTPGFNHCKNVVSDDRLALCGSVNTDFRSYYLHFECGVLMDDVETAKQMKQDFLTSAEKGHEVTLAECQNVPFLKRAFRSVLRLFAMLF